jgi:hypothetical protein
MPSMNAEMNERIRAAAGQGVEAADPKTDPRPTTSAAMNKAIRQAAGLEDRQEAPR